MSTFFSSAMRRPRSLVTGEDDKAADPHHGVRGWIARRPVQSFLLLTFVVAYPVMALPVLAAHGVIADRWMSLLSFMDAERVASVLLVFVAILPAAFVVTWAVDGRAGVWSLVGRTIPLPTNAGFWLLIATGLPVLTLLLALALGGTLEPVDVAPFIAAQMAGLLVNLLLINVAEETGWAGLVQTRLRRKHGLVAAALLTAVPFALVHMPLHFIGNFSLTSLTSALVTLLIVCTLVRLLLGTVLDATGGSVLAAALTHTMFNRSNNDEGIIAALVDGDARKLAGILAVIVLAVILALIARRRRRSAQAGLNGVKTRSNHALTATMKEES
jgi:membrane protease YdiL (CAAX protease family)